VRDEVVYCPICRFEARSTEWNTEAQRDHIREVGWRTRGARSNRVSKRARERSIARSRGTVS